MHVTTYLSPTAVPDDIWEELDEAASIAWTDAVTDLFAAHKANREAHHELTMAAADAGCANTSPGPCQECERRPSCPAALCADKAQGGWLAELDAAMAEREARVTLAAAQNV